MAKGAPASCLRARTRATLVVASILAASACGEDVRVRDWRPEDHGQPPAVADDGQAEPEGAPTGGRDAAAAGLWNVQCAVCHGPAGAGDGPGKPPGAQVPDLTTASWQASRTDAQIAEAIRAGRGMMPAFAERLAPAGIAALVQHTRRLGPASAAPEGLAPGEGFAPPSRPNEGADPHGGAAH